MHCFLMLPLVRPCFPKTGVCNLFSIVEHCQLRLIYDANISRNSQYISVAKGQNFLTVLFSLLVLILDAVAFFSVAL